MDRLKMYSVNKVEENVKKIGEMFPHTLTEVIKGYREDGSPIIENAIDFEMLRQELSDIVVDGTEERYQFTWPDKKKSILLANAPITKTLRPYKDESVDFEDTENLYIEGDNLEVLKLIQETYLGEVKMIYIDPPYNTGNDFIYDDDFAQNTEEYLSNSGQYDDEGNRLVQNTESNGRFHTDWLNMFYPRIKLAKDLLTDDGVIFVSIDDNELENAQKICNEIFGKPNHIATLAVQLNPRGRHLDKFVARTHESILIYGKNTQFSSTMSGVPKEGRMVDEYNREDSMGKYRVLGLRNRNQSFNPVTRPNLYYPLYVNPQNGEVSLIKDEVFVDEVWPDAPDGTKTCWTWAKQKVKNENHLLVAEKTGDEWRIYRKDYFSDEEGNVATTLIKSLWTDKEITNDNGRKVIKDLFGTSIMDFPKSVDLIKKLTITGSGRDSIIMDFFSGSATTAHAVMELNAEDEGNRKFIMVQLPEDTKDNSAAYKEGLINICEIGKERIRRAGKKILKEYSEVADKQDIGFRVLKVDTTNMQDVFYTPEEYSQKDLFELEDNIKPDRSREDLLFQVMLDLGVLLSSKIEESKIEGKKVFNVANGYLIACFDNNVTSEVITEIAKQKPYYAVFRDSSLANDSVVTNFEQIFETYSPTTVRKVL
ncbi:site-specific DNA-methyltransferase [Anaerobacillus sp. MEB173]|uniref:site-specific DNA-methyltransferase n=1 Tax=Anaerobacillus sp. MEB173 TaxID=3383345 RepID=UPI003F8FE5B1